MSKEIHSLKELRIKSGDTQASLAKKLGITQRYCGMLENEERTPSYDVLLRIAEHFGISIDQIKFSKRAKNKEQTVVN